MVWSIWASTSTMAQIPVSRTPRPGCKAGTETTWVRMSGEALNSTQSTPLPETAIEDCDRARARKDPVRRPLQFGQLQFHWGKPPPAAEPRT